MVLLIRGHEAYRRPSDRRVGVSVLGYYDVGVVVVQVVPQHLNDHGPDFVAGVQELSGLVVFERFDEDVGHGADVVLLASRVMMNSSSSSVKSSSAGESPPDSVPLGMVKSWWVPMYFFWGTSKMAWSLVC